MPTQGRATATLAAEIAEVEWYHTMELAPGVVTPGYFDTRPVAAELPFPPLAGRRCLDVATFNGFWAYEMERRGAAEVVAVDVLDPGRWDWPAGSDEEVVRTIGSRQLGGRGFEIAHRALGSAVERLDRSVYELDPADVGRFDFVYLGSLLVHLRDPVGALERVRSVCAGTLLVVDGIDLALSLLLPWMPVGRLDGRGRPWWWYCNSAGLARMIEAAGFDLLAGPLRLFMPRGVSQPRPRPTPPVLRSRAGRDALLAAFKGDPHAAVLARPREGA